MTRVARISYAFIFVLLVGVAWMNMATPLITALFAYLALEKLNYWGKKWLTVSLFVVVVSGILYVFGHFTKEAIVALPKIAENSIPRIEEFLKEKGLHLPSEDPDTLTVKDLQDEAVKAIKENLGLVGNFAKSTTKQLVFVVIGLVVAATLFINPKIDLERERRQLKNNLYTLTCDEIAARFRNFYHSFAMVLGAQMTISAINTTLTAIFILSVNLPYASVIIGVTFLCGLLPIIGNIISNSVIVGIGFTISPQVAMAALVFLIILHKLEYFLNSKIIGDRIKNPVWLTLLGLVIGERLMGIPGMILAPVILHYVKMEAAQIEVAEGTDKLAVAGGNGQGKGSREFDSSL